MRYTKPRTATDPFGGVGDRVADLESPDTADDLYRYRSPDVPRSRPIMQGDVFEGVTIPGLDDGPGLAMVITHACSMRQGPHLRTSVIMARVAPRDQTIPLPWRGHFAVLPLPALRIALLNQRHAHYFTRYAVESAVLHEQSANVLAEAELLEEWLAAAIHDDASDWQERAAAEVVEFDTFVGPLREDLKEPSRRAAVRRSVNHEVRRRFG